MTNSRHPAFLGRAEEEIPGWVTGEKTLRGDGPCTGKLLLSVRRHKWNGNRHGSTSIFIFGTACDRDGATARFNKLLSNPEPDARAQFSLRGEERLKDLR